MSPMSILAVQAAIQALQHAGIDAAGIPENLRFGCIMGSTTGSPQAITQTYETLLAKNEYEMLGASEFFRCISHTVALNVAQYLRHPWRRLSHFRRMRLRTPGRRRRL